MKDILIGLGRWLFVLIILLIVIIVIGGIPLIVYILTGRNEAALLLLITIPMGFVFIDINFLKIKDFLLK